VGLKGESHRRCTIFDSQKRAHVRVRSRTFSLAENVILVPTYDPKTLAPMIESSIENAAAAEFSLDAGIIKQSFSQAESEIRSAFSQVDQSIAQLSSNAGSMAKNALASVNNRYNRTVALMTVTMDRLKEVSGGLDAQVKGLQDALSENFKSALAVAIANVVIATVMLAIAIVETILSFGLVWFKVCRVNV
jgi:hypothetical protein